MRTSSHAASKVIHHACVSRRHRSLYGVMSEGCRACFLCRNLKMKCNKLMILIWTCVTVVIVIMWSLSSLAFTSTALSVNRFSRYWDNMFSGVVCVTSERNQIRTDSSKPKLVLFYKFPEYYELEGASGTEIFKSCVTPCELTVNNTRFAEADLVIFFSHAHINPSVDITPPKKQPGQVWMFFAVESPPFSGNSHYRQPEWHGLFNWTMTYRNDSDFWHGYLRAVPRAEPAKKVERIEDEKKWREMFHEKTKMIAWFVSHCDTNSKREHYVKKLSQYIQIDIYGKCGTHKCDRDEKCLEMVSRDYKFYLSFENALCKDYVTEKLKDIFNVGGVVPIVRGGANYHKLFPPNSVIDTSDFSSYQSLAAHLKDLAASEEAYIKMLQWSWDYEIQGPRLPLCKICSRLHLSQSKSCVYNDVHSWWAAGACHSPWDLVHGS